MFNKVCFHLVRVLSVVVLCFHFSRSALGFDILENFGPTNNVLTYARGLSVPVKLVLMLIVAAIIIVLLRGFIAHIKSNPSKN